MSETQTGYTLSIYSIICLVIGILALLGLDYSSGMLTEKGSAYLTGRYTALLLLPFLASFIIWLISKKNHTANNVTFCIILGLCVLGQVSPAISKRQLDKPQVSQEDMQSIKDSKEDFKNAISNAEDPETYDKAYDEFANNIQNKFSDLSKKSSGEEKEFFAIMAKFVKDAKKSNDDWNNAYNVILSDKIMDYTQLKTEKNYTFQKEAVDTYISETKTYIKFFNNMVPDIEKRLKVLGPKSKYALGAIKGAKDKYEIKEPIVNPLMKTHIKYGKNINQILRLLYEQKDHWELTNDELIIHDDETLNAYNAIIEDMAKNEESINKLSKELIGTI